MRVTESARKHGVEDDDMLHALRNYLKVFSLGEVAMFIGPAYDGAVLEVGVIEDDEDPRIIHAMPARARFWP
jgi:hypothetical protein